MGIMDMEKFLNTKESKEINEIVGEVLAQDFDVSEEVQNRLAYTRKVSVNDIVPEEYQHRLMEIDFTMSQCFWLIGDIAADLVNSYNREKAQLYGKIVTVKDIFSAVGFFCHRSGNSIRYYYACASFFPIEVRQKYEVPFSVYHEARWVDNWELMLKLAQDNPMWSTERVRSEYFKVTNTEPPTRPKTEKPEVPEADDDLCLPESGEHWEAQSRFKDIILSKLEHTIDGLREVLERIPLPVPIKVRIGDVMLEIQDIELEIRREG